MKGDKVIERACKNFRWQYPDRTTPTPDSLTRIVHNCKTHTQFLKIQAKIKPFVYYEDNEVGVLHSVSRKFPSR